MTRRAAAALGVVVLGCGRLPAPEAPLDVEEAARRGLIGDRPATAETLGALHPVRDEALLEALARSLPDNRLRETAARIIVRARIEASAFSEVRDRAADVEELVIATGRNSVSTEEHRPLSAHLQNEAHPTVRIRQLIRENRIELSTDEHGWPLEVRVAGLSRPVQVCASRPRFDPTPCVDANEIELGGLARLDGAGRLTVVGPSPAGRALRIAATGSLSVPVAVAGIDLDPLSLDARFERPDDLVFEAAGPGEKGPDLNVTAVCRPHGRIEIGVDAMARAHSAVLEDDYLARFRVVSRGGRGRDGAPGSMGADGVRGRDPLPYPSTPSAGSTRAGHARSEGPGSGPSTGGPGPGGTGQPGGPGAPGEPGGAGGAITGSIRCCGTGEKSRVSRLASVVQSIGGEGGAGGPGGLGGTGGRGGRSATYNMAFREDKGPHGSSGPPGPSGPPGSPGRIILQELPPDERCGG